MPALALDDPEPPHLPSATPALRIQATPSAPSPDIVHAVNATRSATASGSRRPDGRITTLGVLGGGQLGRMFVHAAQAMGFRTLVLDPDVVSPAGAAADVHLRAAFDDAQALQAMARQCDAVTTEFENVPAEVLQRLAGAVRVAPSAEAVAVCQHRAREKACFLSAGVPCVPHARIETETEAATPDPALFPGVLKTSSLGYDGKGQVRVGAPADLPAAWHALGRRPCVLERRIDLAAEVSVVIARGRDGTVVTLPVHWNLHRDGILAVTVVPASAMATAGPTALDWQDLQGAPAGMPVPSSRPWTTPGCCAWSSSCNLTAPCWPTRWRRAPTTPAIPALTRATCRSSSFRCARWRACPCRCRACTRRP